MRPAQRERRDVVEIRRIMTGAASGVLATVGMSGWMLAGQLVSRHGEQPPKKLVRGAAGRAGVATERRGAGTVLATGAAHLGFGIGAGALYGVVIRSSSVPRGVAYGLGVWAVSYAGWIPALRLMPPPHKDLPGRAWTILSAHAVYGAILGAAVANYDKTRQDATPDSPTQGALSGADHSRVLAGAGPRAYEVG
jgi:hypothetical protein